MSVRKSVEQALSVRQKLALFYGSGLSAEKTLTTPDNEITFDMLLTNGVKAVNICAAGVRPLLLKQHGVVNASQLRRLGFDALHLVDAVYATEACAAYGAREVIEAFLQTPADAVVLAGSDAIGTLGVTVQELMEVCAGAPTEAIEVLKQVTDATPLKGVSSTTLLDTGLRASQLKALGFSLASVRDLQIVHTHDLFKLGYCL